MLRSKVSCAWSLSAVVVIAALIVPSSPVILPGTHAVITECVSEETMVYTLHRQPQDLRIDAVTTTCGTRDTDGGLFTSTSHNVTLFCTDPGTERITECISGDFQTTRWERLFQGTEVSMQRYANSTLWVADSGTSNPELCGDLLICKFQSFSTIVDRVETRWKINITDRVGEPHPKVTFTFAQFIETPNFGITASPTSIELRYGQTPSDTITFTLTSHNGFSGTVTMSALPEYDDPRQGPASWFSPVSTALSAGGTAQSTMNFYICPTTPARPYTFDVTASSGHISHSVIITVTVASSGGTGTCLF